MTSGNHTEPPKTSDNCKPLPPALRMRGWGKEQERGKSGVQLVGAECIFMRPCLSSFFFVWLCGHKFLPSLPPSLPVFLHLSPVFFWHAGQANPPLSTCSCSLFANFPPSFFQSPQPHFIHLPSRPRCHLTIFPFPGSLCLLLCHIFCL